MCVMWECVSECVSECASDVSECVRVSVCECGEWEEKPATLSDVSV